MRLLHLQCSLQSAWSCGAGRAFVSELSEEAQSKRRRARSRLEEVSSLNWGPVTFVVVVAVAALSI